MTEESWEDQIIGEKIEDISSEIIKSSVLPHVSTKKT
jgi:hypothetical protein